MNTKRQALIDAYVAAFCRDVEAIGGYKAHILADPISHARAFCRDLTNAEIVQMTKEQRAETLQVLKTAGQLRFGAEKA